MRYLGNKTKLLDAIAEFTRERGVPVGTVCDPFSGTAAVARHFRALGWRVLAADHMMCAYVLARSALGTAGYPRLGALAPSLDGAAPAAGLPAESVDLARAVHWLNVHAPPREGLCTRQFSPAGSAGRRFFTEENARRIDGAHATLLEWRAAGLVEEGAFHVLLAALLESGDRVANTSGVYAAYLKDWQPNALAPLELRVPRLLADERPHRAACEEAERFVALSAPHYELLYLDPPYNHRQYAAYYHVPEVLARLHTVVDPAALEGSLYGAVGLAPWTERRSEFCVRLRRGGVMRAEAAFARLLGAARADHVVVSYNEEGLVSRSAWELLLREAFGAREIVFRALGYRRYRSDADGDRRAYQRLAGRGRDEVREWLFHARR
ncbi:MAG: DNA adenine methylase [Planctomycetes bacterium]|nr:DNA adenine methylase [Planctomycetota bacterium]